MTFRGWPVEALEFYEGLEADNSKAYWAAHKATYETSVYAPMAELVASLEAEYGTGKIFRPYRDVRFSADKTPYKTTIAATVGDGYVQLSARGLGAGRGMYHMARDQLERYRAAVADERTGLALARALGALRREGIDVISHESLKTAPRGYPADHPRVDLLRRKGLAVWKEWPAAAWLGTAEPRARVSAFLASTQPLSDWLAAHVGPAATDAAPER